MPCASECNETVDGAAGFTGFVYIAAELALSGPQPVPPSAVQSPSTPRITPLYAFTVNVYATPGVRLSTVIDVDASLVSAVAPPGVAVTRYFEITAPLSYAGVDHATVIELVVAAANVGAAARASGSSAHVSTSSATDSGDGPRTFEATSVNVYVVAGRSPLTLSARASAPSG